MENTVTTVLEVFCTQLIPKLTQWVEEFRKYRKKCLRVTLRDGKILAGYYNGFSHELQAIELRIDSDKLVSIPANNIYLCEVLDVAEIAKPSQPYAFGNMRYTLKDFPEPFITKDGSFDVMLAFGEGWRDYADYAETLRSVGKPVPPRFREGRRGDFDYLLTLCAKLGFESARRSQECGELREGRHPTVFPCGRQGYWISQEEKQRTNLITIGSGAVNTLTREVLEFYGNNLPIRFDSPQSDQQIFFDMDDEVKVYDRRNDEEKDIGLIAMLPSPYNQDKFILVAAGMEVAGTQAAILALCDGTDRRLSDMKCSFKGETMWIPMRLVKATEIEYLEHCEIAKKYSFLQNCSLI